MAFDDIVSEVQGKVPKLPYAEAETLVNRAWSKLRDFKLWSFQLISGGQIFIPNQVTAGAVSCTYGSNVVTVNSTAATALNAVPALITPVASTVLGQGMQIRMNFGNSLSNVNPGQFGPYYSITAWDGASQLTLDRPFGEANGTNVPYVAMKVYYAPPALPFTAPLNYDQKYLRYLSLTNISSGYTIRGSRLYWTQDQLNAIDPQRGGTQDTYVLAYYSRNSLGQPVHEFYPGPTYRNTYSATYWTRWPDLTSTQDLPQMPYDLPSLVVHYSDYLADQWAHKNIHVYPELGRTNWVAAMAADKDNFIDLLKSCIRADGELMPRMPTRQGRGFDFPLGGAFLQNHDVSSLLGGY